MWNRPEDHFGNCVTALEYTLLTRAAGELYRRVTVGDTIETPLFRDFPPEHQTYFLGYIMMHFGSPRTEPPELVSATESTIAALFEVLNDQCDYDEEMITLLSSVWAEHLKELGVDDEGQEWASLPLENILEAILDTFLHDRDYEIHAFLTQEDIMQWEFSRIPQSEIERQTEFLMRLYDLSTKPLSEHLDVNLGMRPWRES